MNYVEARVEPEAKRAWREFPGEDVTTSVLPEVAGWIAIYEELASVLRSVIARADGSDEAAQLQASLAWIDDRLAMWRDRHAELAGVVIDRVDHTLTYAGKSLRLTRREADLLDFLLRHPGAPSQASSWSRSPGRTPASRMRRSAPISCGCAAGCERSGWKR